MATTSEVQICNEAIALVGGNRIIALTDSSEEGRLCSLFYVTERDALLRSHRWNFARVRSALATTTAPAFGWDYAFVLPPDCLRVVEFNGSETTDEANDDFEIESGLLLTDAETANIVYVAKVTDTATFDPLFSKVLALRLGAALSRKLTGSESLGAKLLAEAENLLPRARQTDANETRSRKRPWPMDSDFVNSRFS